jgi:hypothetical protein
MEGDMRIPWFLLAFLTTFSLLVAGSPQADAGGEALAPPVRLVQSVAQPWIRVVPSSDCREATRAIRFQTLLFVAGLFPPPPLFSDCHRDCVEGALFGVQLCELLAADLGTTETNCILDVSKRRSECIQGCGGAQ